MTVTLFPMDIVLQNISLIDGTGREPLDEMPRALALIEIRDPAVKKVIVHPNG